MPKAWKTCMLLLRSNATSLNGMRASVVKRENRVFNIVILLLIGRIVTRRNGPAMIDLQDFRADG
jgi:hypothetical protein